MSEISRKYTLTERETDRQTDRHIHTNTHTHTHTNTHTQTHTHKHTDTQTSTQGQRRPRPIKDTGRGPEKSHTCTNKHKHTHKPRTQGGVQSRTPGGEKKKEQKHQKKKKKSSGEANQGKTAIKDTGPHTPLAEHFPLRGPHTPQAPTVLINYTTVNYSLLT